MIIFILVIVSIIIWIWAATSDSIFGSGHKTNKFKENNNFDEFDGI